VRPQADLHPSDDPFSGLIGRSESKIPYYFTHKNGAIKKNYSGENLFQDI
jgi:hypothetical protein